MLRKTWLFVSIALILFISASFSSAIAAEKLIVGIWDPNQQSGIQKILDEWTAVSGIEAETQVTTWNEYWTVLEAGASGGTLPDVFWMHSNVSQKYMENGILLDLTDQIAKSEVIELENYYADIVNLYSYREALRNSEGYRYDRSLVQQDVFRRSRP